MYPVFSPCTSRTHSLALYHCMYAPVCPSPSPSPPSSPSSLCCWFSLSLSFAVVVGGVGEWENDRERGRERGGSVKTNRGGKLRMVFCFGFLNFFLCVCLCVVYEKVVFCCVLSLRFLMLFSCFFDCFTCFSLFESDAFVETHEHEKNWNSEKRLTLLSPTPALFSFWVCVFSKTRSVLRVCMCVFVSVAISSISSTTAM